MKRALSHEALPSPAKTAYDQVAFALERGQTTMDWEIFCHQDPLLILQAVTGDNPSLIWFNHCAFRRQTSFLGGSRIFLSDVLPVGRREKMTRELDMAVGRVLAAIEQENPLTDYDRLSCLYEYLQSTVSYDEETLHRARSQDSTGLNLSHNAYGALVNGLAVCDGIAAALALVAQAMGYAATVVHGSAIRDGLTEDHAWTMVRAGGQCYHLDLTWDLGKGRELGVCGYDYFCLDDGSMAIDHQWPAGIVPRCSATTLSWFHHNRCYANNLTQVGEILERYARSKTTTIRLRLADGVAVPGEEGMTLCRMLTDALGRAGRAVPVRYIWNPHIRCLTARLGP